MNRINVYPAPEDLYGEGYASRDAGPKLAGWFDADKADGWSDRDYNGNGSGGTGRGQAVYRTAQGRWVLEHWTCWQGEADRCEFIEPEQAREWLLSNSEDEAVTKYFGEPEEERGPGRPKVGEQVCFTIGADELAAIDLIAKQDGKGRSAILRNAVAAFVQPVKESRTETTESKEQDR